MTEDHYKEIETFASELTLLRMQVDDRTLLDSCQQYLNELLAFSEDVPLDPTPPPVNDDVPHATGAAAVGATLNCTMGIWTNTPTSYAYQWLNDGSPALNGGAADYVVVDGDRGHSLSCVVTATNSGGSTAAPPSNAIAIPA